VVYGWRKEISSDASGGGGLRQKLWKGNRVGAGAVGWPFHYIIAIAIANSVCAIWHTKGVSVWGAYIARKRIAIAIG